MVGNLPANKYLKDSGVKLVNEFTKLDDKKKSYKVKIEEIDEELEEIKKFVEIETVKSVRLSKSKRED